VLVNLVLLWRQYTHGVILESWAEILWAANLSFAVQAAVSLVLCFYRPARLNAFLQLLSTAGGLVSVIVFFTVFPLDFAQMVGPWLNTLVKIFLIVGIGGTSIGVILWLVRFVAGTGYEMSKA
jgi:hypothetical protein